MKKTKAQQRLEWERRIWTALVEYANTGNGFETLVSESLHWIGGDGTDTELCKDVQSGASLDSLSGCYREPVRNVLTWLSAPENRALAAKACWFLMEHGNQIKMVWSESEFNPKEKGSMLISEWPEEIGSVISPVCKFIKDQIDRHDIAGEPLRDVIPIGMCDRPGCGKFRLIKLYRPGHFFCSNVCKATFHQASKTPKQKAKYMRDYRKTLDRNEPKGGRLIVRRGRKKTGGK